MSEELRGGRSGEDIINSQGAGDQGMSTLCARISSSLKNPVALQL